MIIITDQEIVLEDIRCLKGDTITIEEFKEHHEWVKHWVDSYTMHTMERFTKQ